MPEYSDQGNPDIINIIFNGIGHGITERCSAGFNKGRYMSAKQGIFYHCFIPVQVAQESSGIRTTAAPGRDPSTGPAPLWLRSDPSSSPQSYGLLF